jgi:UDP-glucose 4-epimerase
VADRLLAEGHRVIAVDDLSLGRIANLGEARGYGKEFTFLNMDIRAEGLIGLFERHKPEVVMHLAAQPGVRPSMEDPTHDASVNVMGLLNVLECCARSGVIKVVFASSGGTIYGEPKKVPVKETSAAASHPLSPYGISKKVALDYLRFYERYRGVGYTALALGNVYGPRQNPHGEAGVIAIFSDKMMSGESPVIFGDGNQTRDFVFIDDVTHAFALAIEHGPGKLVNIGTGIETSVRALYKMLAEIFEFSGKPQKGTPPPGELRKIALDVSQAATVLNWKPWTHLEDGLRETAAFLKGV